MILVGSQRSGAIALANHLMNERDNDHVTLVELRGFIADDLHGALKEAHAISKATKCTQYLFSLSLNPPADQDVPEQAFHDAADGIENKLGLESQPRAIVFHEKEGRRHAHVVWSRINVETMTAINLPHYKTKLRDMARGLFLDYGWNLPDGLATYGNKNPLNFTLSEWQQAKRQKLDPREIKQAFLKAWENSDSLSGYRNALEERGYFLARGDRRGFVALDFDGNTYAVAKWSGVKAKDVKTKLGSPDNLPSVDTVKQSIRTRLSHHLRDFIAETKQRHVSELRPMLQDRDNLVQSQRIERQRMKDGQAERWLREAKERQERFNTGLRGVVDRLTGKRRDIGTQNIQEALACHRRDQSQRDRMALAHIKERQIMMRDMNALKAQQQRERRALAQDIRNHLRLVQGFQKRLESTCQKRTRDRGPSLTP